MSSYVKLSISPDLNGIIIIIIIATPLLQSQSMNLTQIEGLLKFKMIQKFVAMQIVVTQNNQQHQKTNKQKNLIAFILLLK